MKSTHKKKSVPKIIKLDPWLAPFEEDIRGRISRYKKTLKRIENDHGSLSEYASSYDTLGIHYDKKKKGWWYREWAPKAALLSVIGDFNQWDRRSHLMKLNPANGLWEVFISESELKEGDQFKVHIIGDNGGHDRIPAYIREVKQDKNTHEYRAVAVKGSKFEWEDDDFSKKLKKIVKAPLIYEAHIGMAQEKEGYGTYKEFEELVLPRIKKLGYNVIQLMAIKEHPYYGSFGYHVSNFFAPCHHFGSAEDLRSLINKAHELGIAVIMDLVHSHSVKNFAEGLNEFDGSEDQYFHAGGRGYHNQWDSKLFNYGKDEVLQFLLSNVKYWIDEFHFDGYRFDGITSMMYFHHGDFMTFDHYDTYFNDVEWDALLYLQLANKLVHELKTNGLTIAEDMSGMPGLGLPQKDGGIGFDYRLAMGVPDFWIKLLKEQKDEQWNMHEIWHVLNNRRANEPVIAYAESHDQAIVGDKTIAFRLMDKEMYWHMNADDPNFVIDRGIALHKMLRMLTLSLGGEGYLNFIGNEFGHPEWIDFPREGNHWSFKYAQRKWSLVDNENLKYQFLSKFDKDMIHLAKKHKVLESNEIVELNIDNQNKVIAFMRGDLVFVFNFHPVKSIPDYEFYCPVEGDYKIILNSDDKKYGGHNRVDDTLIHSVIDKRMKVYSTNRTCLVLKKI
ncbi:alpha amylase C-terminal domain-containing protein [Aureibacter tunicatorum]|uniref:1,4-alpha-glucan branching enzyme n=1 Tax=Aureibacter tunicatorum TaxID=866807 RepID=A0AAE3XKP8_9BACT|nr:alpha amylase C-terminal domain-containing protein [Aureibacter tunicatorum]MDR6237705.1 1,4-alpha-glucan branching enzyme [Aureibacter tunicatorum]BDD02740.1 1,4-alpha-glucan branching enzyme [Aureibacter tunicatorum]